MSRDSVNHPRYYRAGRLEVIDVIEEFGLNFRLGNVTKYVLRAGRKGDAVEDLRKAAWYLARDIAECERARRAAKRRAAKRKAQRKAKRKARKR